MNKFSLFQMRCSIFFDALDKAFCHTTVLMKGLITLIFFMCMAIINTHAENKVLVDSLSNGSVLERSALNSTVPHKPMLRDPTSSLVSQSTR